MARHLLAWLVVIGVSGCSLALDGPQPNRPRNYAPKCDSSKGLVVADGLLATAFGIGALAAFGDDAPEAGAVTGLIAVAFIAAAVRGNSVVEECRTELESFARAPLPLDEREDERRAVAASRPLAQPASPAPETVSMPGPAPETPADPYEQPHAEPRPPVKAQPQPPVRTQAQPQPRQAEPAADPDAWRDFWTEVP